MNGQDLVAQGLFVRGLTQARLSNFEGALEAYATALDLVGPDATILLAMAEAYEALDQPDDALFFAQQVARADESALAPLLLIADLLRAAERPGEALAAYERALERDPDADEARAAQAALLESLGRVDESIQAQRARLAHVSDPRPIRRQLIRLYDKTSQTDAALAEVEALLDEDPYAYPVRLDLARRYLDAERTDEAQVVLDALRTDYPHDAQVAVLLARAMQDADAEGATALLAGLGASEDPDALFGRAAALFNRAENDPAVRPEAMAALERLLALETRPDALRMLGLLHRAQGNAGEAARLVARAVQAEPRRLDWWAEAIQTALFARNASLAERLSDEALLLFPGQPTLVDAASVAYLEADRPRDAAYALRTLDAPSATQLERLGDAESALGNGEAARIAWEQALVLDPNNAVLREKLTRAP
ncbi:MAG: tetratricopeptide repeat protein [Bacteroidota bacterium]